ncbi:hypothetical protein H310_03527 [Aphanomyces invadans]|uniref:Secreted protein n=1 Tax=Aphanomyces invadans TaxID=157072 RepID=A0A024UHV8_9STRA|nr:hypothetical protein H310_03527 [Aphanomyces invadans]ETW05869.1 hypothetical protein H310_03527 [Aphanomyces invadans]|eukprot:XP_008865646.1 hypothetical protein H310_03527 [Aphanomyces invadans]
MTWRLPTCLAWSVSFSRLRLGFYGAMSRRNHVEVQLWRYRQRHTSLHQPTAALPTIIRVQANSIWPSMHSFQSFKFSRNVSLRAAGEEEQDITTRMVLGYVRSHGDVLPRR